MKGRPPEDPDAPIDEEILARFPEGLRLFHRLRMIAAGKLPPEAVLGKREEPANPPGASRRRRGSSKPT